MFSVWTDSPDSTEESTGGQACHALTSKGTGRSQLDCFSPPPAQVGCREQGGISAPTEGSVSTPLPQRQPFSEAHNGRSGSNNNKDTGESAMVANKHTFFYLIP